MSRWNVEGRPGTASWRADIDGLRAVAILAVVGYHFFPRLVPAGFIGVDVFFVISGFLITRILVSAHEAGRFSLLDFYAARARRLFPALLLVLAAVTVAGWACLYEHERAQLGLHLLAGAGFFSNLQLWRESGYFDAATETKALAHLWSLGVEEQFYLLWPVVLGLLVGRRWLLHAVAVLLVASLLAAIAVLPYDRGAAFYLPVFRFWELLAGAMVALFERHALAGWLRGHADRTALAGFVLLGLAFLLIDSADAFPGWWATLPVLATALVIAAGPLARPNRLLLSNRGMTAIGLISYPLYLWHWPVLVFARLAFNAEPRQAALPALLALSFVLAWLTWRFVETPLRSASAGHAKALGLAVAMACMGVGGLQLARIDGLLHRDTPAYLIPPAPEVLLARNRDVAEGCGLADPAGRAQLAFCLHDARGAERFALVGDSKAQVLFNGLVRTSLPEARWLFLGGAQKEGALVPLLSTRSDFESLQPAVRLALDSLASNPRIETVVIATATRALYLLPRSDTIDGVAVGPRHAAALEGLRAFTAELLRAGKKVVLLVDNPTLPDPRKCVLPSRFTALAEAGRWFTDGTPKGCHLPLEQHRAMAAPYFQLLDEVRQLAPDRVQVFDSPSLLCHAGACRSRDAEGILYSYSDHISDLAAGRIGAALNRSLAGGTPRP